MAHSHRIAHAAGQGRDDRISKLGDSVLGHILSFLPAKEAARAAVLSTRWRDVFGSVHTVSLEEPEGPIPNFDGVHSYGTPRDRNPPMLFTSAVTAALLARHRRAHSGVALRALRVGMEQCSHGDWSTVDHWVSYALKQAVHVLDLRLQQRAPVCSRPYSLRRAPVCSRPYSLRVVGGTAICPDDADEEIVFTDENGHSPGARFVGDVDGSNSDGYNDSGNSLHAGSMGEHDDDFSTVGDDDISSYAERNYVEGELPPVYAIPRGLFSCAELRSLRIGPCRLSPPAAISLPSLEELLLTHISDAGQDVQRLISACPRLADLTLEACDTVTALSLLDRRPLHRLALRCCHKLASVAVDASELHVFEYRGAVPETSFLTMRGGSRPSLTSCKVDICGEEVSSEAELTKLTEFLHYFVGTYHLHLQSARIGSGVDKHTFFSFPAFSRLRHLEVRGSLPHDNEDAILGAMGRILQHAPSLEVLSLIFQPKPGHTICRHRWFCTEREFLGVHHLEYNPYNVLDAPAATIIPACLTNRVREINLVHYQGGRAQRTLARFLLCNAPALDELYCGFAPGPLWIQTKLKEEIQGWAMNKPEKRIFY